MELQHVSVRVAHEEERGAGRELDLLGDHEARLAHIPLGVCEVAHLQRDVRVARVLLGDIHQLIHDGPIFRGVQDQVEVDAAGMLHHGDGLRADGALYEDEAQLLVEGTGGGELADAEAHVVDPGDLVHLGLLLDARGASKRREESNIWTMDP